MHNFLEKLKAAGRISLARTLGVTSSRQSSGSHTSPIRVLFVANAFIPTLQLSFFKPLSSMVNSGEVAIELLSEQQMKELFGKRLREPEVHEWINKRFDLFLPTMVVFCRYSGPHVGHIIDVAQIHRAPTIFHIDDDLLNVPVEIGQKKFEFHNHSSRLAAVTYLLEHVDLVYCSTEMLKQRLMSYGFNTRFSAGKIYCSSEIMVPASKRQATKIGYMGFDHAHDFEIVLPVMVDLLRCHPRITFELFGSIPKPTCLNEFGDRVSVIPPVREYGEFMKRFAELSWDIGICPLAPTSFNTVKANTKWVEYTSVGAAVIASGDTVYDNCCQDDCGLLATTHGEWLASLELLLSDDDRRFQMVSNAQRKLEQEYSVRALQDQVLSVFNEAKSICKCAV